MTPEERWDCAMKRVFKFKKGEDLEPFMTNDFLDVLEKVCKDGEDVIDCKRFKITCEWSK